MTSSGSRAVSGGRRGNIISSGSRAVGVEKVQFVEARDTNIQSISHTEKVKISDLVSKLITSK